MALSDPGFFAAFQQGNQKVFEEVFRAYEPEMYAEAHRMLQRTDEAEDVISESFFKLWLNREKIKDLGHIKGFLYTTVRNKCVDILRKGLKYPHISTDKYILKEIQDLNDPYISYLDRVRYLVVIKLLKEEIEKFSPRRKEVVFLYLIGGLPMKKIAQLMGINYTTAHRHWQKAVTALLKALKNKGLRLFIILVLMAVLGSFLKK